MSITDSAAFQTQVSSPREIGFRWLNYTTRTGILLNPIHIIILGCAVSVFVHGALMLFAGKTPHLDGHRYLSLALDISILGLWVIIPDVVQYKPKGCRRAARWKIRITTCPVENLILLMNIGIACNYLLYQCLR